MTILSTWVPQENSNALKDMLSGYANRSFHKLDKIGNNANIDIRDFTMQKQNIPVTKCYFQ